MFRIGLMLVILALGVLPGFASAQQQVASIRLPGTPSGARAMMANPVTNKVYLVLDDSHLAVIDGATNVAKDLGIVDSEAGVLAIDPVANKVYATRAGALLVIDADDAIDVIPVAGRISSVVPNAATGSVYLTTSSGGTAGPVPGAANVSVVANGIGLGELLVGITPSVAALNPITGRVYAVDNATASVLEIDTATRTATSIPIPSPAGRVAVNPVTNRIYAGQAGAGGHEVYAVDGASRAVTTIPIEHGPEITGLVVDPATNRIYVTVLGFPPFGVGGAIDHGAVSVIDGQTHAVLSNTSLNNPNSIALDPVTNRVYMRLSSRSAPGALAALDGASGTVSMFGGGGASGGAIAVNPVTNRIYSMDTMFSTVAIFDAALNKTLTWNMGGVPSAIAVNPITDTAYVATSANSVQAIRGPFNSLPAGLSDTIPVGSTPRSIAIDPMINRVYTANQASSNVTVIDGNTQSTTQIAVAPSPNIVSVNPVTHRVLVVSGSPIGTGPGMLSVIDGNTNAVTRQIPLDPVPTSLAVSIATDRVYLGTLGRFVHVVDASTGDVTRLDVGTNTIDVAVNPTDNRIYVAVATGPLAIIDGESNAVTTLDLGPIAHYSVAVDPVTNRIFVGKADGNVAVIDADRFTVTNVNVGADPVAIAVDTVANRIYVSKGSASNTVAVIDGATLAVASVITGGTSLALAVSPVAGSAYFALSGASSVIEVRGSRLSLAQHGVEPTVTPPVNGGTVTRLADPVLSVAACCMYAPNDPAVQALYYGTRNTQSRFARANGTGPFNATLTDAVPGVNFAKLFTLDAMAGVANAPALIGAPEVFAFVDVAPVITTPPTLPDAFINAPYSTTLAAVGGTAPRQFTVLAGMSLPPGLTLSTSGVLSGTPTANGFFTFRVDVSDASGGSTSRVFGLLVDAAAGTTLANISTRGAVGNGENVMIAGFVISGSAPKKVLVTAIGPALRTAGIANPIADPAIRLVRPFQGVIATNDNWVDAPNAEEIRASGFAPASRLEPAILATLDPGPYTALVDGGTGSGLVAVYEVDHPEVPLINISTRGQVLTGNDVMIAGFVIQGTAPQTVVVTGIGPSLASAGIANPLANPTLTLVRASDGAVLATNDDWPTAPNKSQIAAAGFAPASSAESAIMMTLDPGAYTAVLSGVGGGTGVGIVAVYRR